MKTQQLINVQIVNPNDPVQLIALIKEVTPYFII